MDENYDVIVLGTGLTECIISGLLSMDGKKVLHLDRNDRYGGETASLNLTQIYAMFKPGETPPESFGKDRDWNIDLIPKLSMACGDFTTALYHTRMGNYMSFSNVKGSYMYKNGEGICKIPTKQSEIVASRILGILDKTRLWKFFKFIGEYDSLGSNTTSALDLKSVKTSALFDKYSLSQDARDIVGHLIALHQNDDYLNEPAQDTFERIRLYLLSFAQSGISPYIYPLYGLGEIPQGFARLSAIYGGSYMLNKPVDEIVLDENGKFSGVRSGDEIAKAEICIGDPSYFPSKVKKTGQTVRKICIFSHPLNKTNEASSLQIIIPHKEIQRKNDIYVVVLSSDNFVCAKNFWIAIASTVVETNNPLSELDKVVDIIGPVLEQFTWVLDTYVPLDDGTSDNIFISESYDSTSNFESVYKDVKGLYKRITKRDLEIKENYSRVENDNENR